MTTTEQRSEFSFFLFFFFWPCGKRMERPETLSREMPAIIGATTEIEKKN